MDPGQTIAALLSENQQLGQENDQWKLMLSVFRENQLLKTRLQSLNNSLEDVSVCCPSVPRPSASQWQNTLEERHFRKSLLQNKQEHRTSSPVDLPSFVHSAMHGYTSDRGVDFESCHADVPLDLKGPVRLLGEIAYQLDRRILSYIFQGQRRLYGFTLINIPGKIMEVSAHPLTGKVDEGYRLHLARRYADLMERLSRVGYQATLHPPFTEFIVNTYGILKERPGEHSSQGVDYNKPDFLRSLIMTKAPRKLQKDLLLVLKCLCTMAAMDRKPLILW